LARGVGGPDKATIGILKNQVPGGGEVEGGTKLDWTVTVGGPNNHNRASRKIIDVKWYW
jgi:hypothetical protein